MLIDRLSEFCEKQAWGNSARSALHPLGNVVDLGVPKVQGSQPYPPYLAVVITTAATGTASNTVEIVLCEDDATSGDNLTASNRVLTFGPQRVDALTAGTIMMLPLPRQSSLTTVLSRMRYLQMCVIKDATTAGAFSAFMTFEPIPGWVPFADGKIGFVASDRS